MEQCDVMGPRGLRNCKQCPYHKYEQILTSDSWEHEYGVYCGLTPDKTDSWVRNTYRGKMNFRIVSQSDNDAYARATPPSWCPLELRWLRYAAGCLKCHPQYLAWREAVDQYDTGDPRFAEHRQRHGLNHVERATKAAREFLNSCQDVTYGYYPEHDAILCEIALLLRDVGRPFVDSDDWPFKSAEMAMEFLREFPALTINDILSIVDAIKTSTGIMAIETPLAAAVLVGENLDIFYSRMFGEYCSIADKVPQLVEPYKSLCYVGNGTFTIKKQKGTDGHMRYTGVLNYSQYIETWDVLEQERHTAELVAALTEHPEPVRNIERVAKEFLRLNQGFEFRINGGEPIDLRSAEDLRESGEYMTASDYATANRMTLAQVRKRCQKGQIIGARKLCGMWLIPKDA